MIEFPLQRAIIQSSMLESDADLLCGPCGYNLRGVDSSRCPVCGAAFDRNHLVSNLIPLEQKRQIGRILAYFRTADAVTRRPRDVAAKASHPVSLKAAKRFTTITVIVVFLSLLPVVATMLQGFAYDPD